jgi:hypothetical protein
MKREKFCYVRSEVANGNMLLNLVAAQNARFVKITRLKIGFVILRSLLDRFLAVADEKRFYFFYKEVHKRWQS